MAIIKHKSKKKKGYESLSREFLQRNDLSLESRGLLSYMESMPDDYIFHKTQLYRCFEKNKKTSVERIWNELLDKNFIIAYSKGIAPKKEYEYLFTHVGFSNQEISELNEEYLKNGWEVAYRSGSNRKPSSYYRERAKTKESKEKEKASEGSKYQGVENQHPDNSGNLNGVDFEQHDLNSTKSTDIISTNKSFIVNGDEEEENKNNKENKQKIKENIEKRKNNIINEFGNKVGKALISEAANNTKQNLFDIDYYDSYFLNALEKVVLKHRRFISDPQDKLERLTFSSSILDPNNFK